MKPKNIVLLGFVNKAVKYLDQHIDEDQHDYKLSKLKNIDLVSLEDELSKNLEYSLGSMQSTMTSLLQAGNEAFDEFLNSHTDKIDLVGQLNDIFNIDLDDDKEKSDQEELEELLSFYNLDESVNIPDEEIIPEEEKQEETNEELDSIFEKALEEEKNIIGETAKEVNPEVKEIVGAPELVNEEELVFEEFGQDLPDMSQEDEFLQEIAKANQNKDEQIVEELFGENDELDNIFSEIVDHENEAFEPEEEIELVDEEIPLEDMLVEDVILQPSEIQESILNELVDEPLEEIEQEEEEEVEVEETIEAQEEPIVSYTFIENPAVDEYEEPVEEEIQEEGIIETSNGIEADEDLVLKIEEFNNETDVPVFEEIEENNVDVDQELETIQNYVPEELPEEAVEENNPEEQPYDYISSLYDDLRKQMELDEQIKAQEEEERRQMYEKVHESYPYLSNSFVKTVYDMKDDINRDYPEDTEAVLLHRVIFDDVEDLKQFAEVVMNHGYEINVDEDQKIVDCMKNFKNKKGVILAYIFEIANQASKMHGTYDGYRVFMD